MDNRTIFATTNQQKIVKCSANKRISMFCFILFCFADFCLDLMLINCDIVLFGETKQASKQTLINHSQRHKCPKTKHTKAVLPCHLTSTKMENKKLGNGPMVGLATSKPKHSTPLPYLWDVRQQNDTQFMVHIPEKNCQMSIKVA